jgi:hypothetical protein
VKGGANQKIKKKKICKKKIENNLQKSKIEDGQSVSTACGLEWMTSKQLSLI